MSDTTTTTVATNANAKRTRKGQPTSAQQIEALRKDLARATERGEASTSKGKRIRRALRALGWFGGSRTRTSTDPRVTGKGKGKANRVMRERTAKPTSVRPDASSVRKASKRTSHAERAANRADGVAEAKAFDAYVERLANADKIGEHDSNGTA